MSMDMLAPIDSGPCCAKPMDVREGLVAKKTRLEAQLAEVNAALAAVDDNPGIVKLFDLIVKAGRY